MRRVGADELTESVAGPETDLAARPPDYAIGTRFPAKPTLALRPALLLSMPARIRTRLPLTRGIDSEWNA